MINKNSRKLPEIQSKSFTNVDHYVWNSKQYKKDFLRDFHKLTDIELAAKFNGRVRKRYFNFYIQGFMDAMREEIERRKIDFSEIGNEKTMSYANKVKIIDGKMIKIENTNNQADGYKKR